MTSVAVIDPSLFTIPYDLALCHALAATGCEVTLFGRPLRPGEDSAGRTPIDPFFYRRSEPLRRRLTGTAFRLVKGIEHYRDITRLVGRLTETKPDIIHFQWTPLPAIDHRMIGRFRRVAPVVLTVHDITPFNNSPGSRLQRIGSVAILRAFDHLIVHSDSSRATLLARGLPPDRISVIPHGALSVAKSPTHRLSPPHQTTVLLFGRLKTYKGADILIEAFGRLSPADRRLCRLLIVGEPLIDMAPLKQRAAELGLAEHITWDLRYVGEAELDVVMSQSDLFVFPYRDIDASGVLMSCLSYGKPIVASNIGAFAVLIKNGVHGYLVPPEDPVALADALVKIVRDPALAAQYGRNVKTISETIPSWDEIATRTVALYTRLTHDRT